MNYKVYVDGQEGTTGLRIHEVLAQRADIERKHGTNAPRLAAEVVRGLAADKAEAGEDGTAELEEVGGAATGN